MIDSYSKGYQKVLGKVRGWKGSTINAVAVARQIADRWGVDAACEYNPRLNCFTYSMWRMKGFIVKPNEKPIIIHIKGNPVRLYFYKQVEEIK